MLLIGALISPMLFTGCDKDENQQRTPIDHAKLAEDVALSDQIYGDIFEVVNNESGTPKNSSSVNGCGVVTLTEGLLSVDYGNGCTDNHGILRSGSFTATYNGDYFTPGSSLTVVTDNYFVNGHTVNGALAITNNGRNSSNNLEFEATVQQGSIIKPDGSVVTFQSTRIFEWNEGDHGIFSWCDNAWLVSGISEGTTSDGHEYSVEITTPLKKRSCCPWVVEGMISISADGTQTASLNYGNGACDRLALYTHNGISQTITLP